jgi:hypothetical protein
MVRQAHHERNKQVAVHPELVEGLNQSLPKDWDAIKGALFDIPV